MSLMSMYENIKSPFENSGLIREFINIYFQSTNFDDFSKKVTFLLDFKPCQIENKDIIKCSKESFMKYMFSIWRKNILSFDYNGLPLLMKDDLDQRDLFKLKEYLQDIEEIMLDEKQTKQIDEEIDNLIKKYNWYKTDGNWIKINSTYVNLFQDNSEPIQHVLSLNIKSTSVTYKIIHCFILLCNKYNLTYDLKYTNNSDRYNTLVIYSSTANLSKYIDIIQFIKKQFKDINVLLDKPAMLSGTLYDNIGYCSKPYVNEELFLNQRLNYIYRAIQKSVNQWYDNLVKVKTSPEENITYYDQILNSIYYMLQAKINLSESNPLRDVVFSQKLKRIMKHFSTLKLNEINDINLGILDKDKIIVTKREIMNIIKEVYLKIFKYEHEFTSQIINEIEVYCKEYEIDFNTFCCDQKTINEIMEYDFKVSNQKNGVIITPSVDTWYSNPLLLPYFIGPDSKVYPSYQDYLNKKNKKKVIKV